MAERNKHGMLRSKAMMAAHPEQAPGLHHMRIHPADGEGKIKVTHHAGPDAKAHATHSFDAKNADPLVEHMMEHSGAAYNSEGGGDHFGDEAGEEHQ
jgi:hypothetical protein